jgi:leader peptidase (prepilin peptidase)/N-methyltransferase
MIHELDLRPALPFLAFDLLALIIGLAVGSFANVCIYRIPRKESVVKPPSRCPACGALVRAFDNVPVLSWFWLRGRCRSCRAPFSFRYPLVEAANGLLYLGLALIGGLSAWTFVAMPFATALLVLALIDFDVQLLPNVITLPGIALGIAASFLYPAWPVRPLESMASAAGGYLALLLVNLVYGKVQQAKTAFEPPLSLRSLVRLIVKLVRERFQGQEGLGQGDWKMAAFLGAFMGWEKMLLVVFLASLGGTAVGLGIIVLGRGDGKTKIPLGTFLSVAAILVLFGGDPILSWYKGFFRG